MRRVGRRASLQPLAINHTPTVHTAARLAKTLAKHLSPDAAGDPARPLDNFYAALQVPTPADQRRLLQLSLKHDSRHVDAL